MLMYNDQQQRCPWTNRNYLCIGKKSTETLVCMHVDKVSRLHEVSRDLFCQKSTLTGLETVLQTMSNKNEKGFLKKIPGSSSAFADTSLRILK